MKKGVKIAIGAVSAVVATAAVYLVGFVCGWGAAKDDGFDPDKDEELGEMEFYDDDPTVGSTEGLFDDETEITDENDEVDNSMFDGEEGEE